MSLSMKAGLPALCLAAGLFLLSPGLAQGEDESEFGVLVVAEGVEDTYYNCVACHSERIIAQQGLTRAGWADLFEWMVEEHGMHYIDPETQAIMLDYLETHYNVDRPNFPN
ncbi:MAG: aldehyde dehydrogenase [Pseudomonadota bacterium]